MANLNQQYSEIRRAYYENFMAFKHSDAYKSLPAEQKFQVDKTAKETWQAISDAEKASAPVDAQEERANRGILKNIVTDTTSGMLNVGRSGASLAAWGADVAGLPDVAKPLDQISKDLGDTSQRIAPAANPDNLIDFGSQSLLQNLPMLATAGIAGEVMAGSEAGGAALHALRSAAGVPAAAGAAPLSEAAGSFLGTLGTYGVPSIRQANVEAGAENRGGMVGDGNPYFELAAAVPYALIENTLGVTPLKTMRAFSGRAASTGITKTLTASAGKIGALLEKPLFELSGKAGLRGTIGAFARFVADNILGEATEEVLQGIEEIAIPHFAKKPINQAIRDTIAELGKPETFENLKTQALGGGIVGTLLGGGNVLMRKIANITAEINNPDTTPEEAQRLADLKTQFKAELLQLTDHAGMPNVTDNTTENFQEPGDWQSIHPQQILGAPAPEVTYPDGVQPQNIGTEGS
ncbi:MAG: hypothetical protein KKB51_23670, partial [Candidatus Riflebacteria bacterium]|nr:hypothetical protein [Candidatus Riflebacteria bacterium]